MRSPVPPDISRMSSLRPPFCLNCDARERAVVVASRGPTASRASRGGGRSRVSRGPTACARAMDAGRDLEAWNVLARCEERDGALDGRLAPVDEQRALRRSVECEVAAFRAERSHVEGRHYCSGERCWLVGALVQGGALGCGAGRCKVDSAVVASGSRRRWASPRQLPRAHGAVATGSTHPCSRGRPRPWPRS